MVIDAQTKFAVSEQFKMDNNHPSIWCRYIVGDIANHPEIRGYKIVCVQLVCHRTRFSLLFLSIFNPTSLTLLTTPFSFMIIFLMSFSFMPYSCLRTDDKNMIQLVYTGLPISNLLSYQHPETVPFLFDHPILHWNFLGRPRLLPQLKVPDFPDMEHE